MVGMLNPIQLPLGARPRLGCFLQSHEYRIPTQHGSLSSTGSPESPPCRVPVMLKSESESKLDVQIVEKVKPRSKRLSSTSRGGKKSGKVMVKEKQKKKQNDVKKDDEESEAECKRKKRERKRGPRIKYIDNDGDIEKESDADSMRMKKKKKKKKWGQRVPVSDMESPAKTKSPPLEKKTKTSKSKEKQPPSDPEFDYVPPTRKHSRSHSESRRSSKRKFPYSDNGHSDDEVDDQELSAKRESLKKCITEINLAKRELCVEEDELKAKLHWLDRTFRKHHTEIEGSFCANCICSTCGKYGHKKFSITYELNQETISVAA